MIAVPGPTEASKMKNGLTGDGIARRTPVNLRSVIPRIGFRVLLSHYG